MRLKVRNIFDEFILMNFLEMKKAVASDGKARAEAERCRKMSNQAIKEHATMKEQYTMNVTGEGRGDGGIYKTFFRFICNSFGFPPPS